jgi:hypothetical protein
MDGQWDGWDGKQANIGQLWVGTPLIYTPRSCFFGIKSWTTTGYSEQFAQDWHCTAPPVGSAGQWQVPKGRRCLQKAGIVMTFPPL